MKGHSPLSFSILLPCCTSVQHAALVHRAYTEFYVGPYWGSYFFGKAKRYTSNSRYWWFFRMMAGYMRNIGPIKDLVMNLGVAPKDEDNAPVMANPSKTSIPRSVPGDQVPKETIPFVK
ncbi:MAG: hypothetical protein Q6373_021420 [Candidatus Sigynarchaeota archaeon]